MPANCHADRHGWGGRIQSGLSPSSSGLFLFTPGRCRPLSASWPPSICGWVTQVRMS
ncbi:hypothetical protein D3C76_1761500 [compost metagenome]